MARVTSQTKVDQCEGHENNIFNTEKVDLRFLYGIQVSPQNAPNSDVLKKLDFISLRLVVDGMPYRESSAIAILQVVPTVLLVLLVKLF